MKVLLMVFCALVMSCSNAGNNTITDSLPATSTGAPTTNKKEGNIEKMDIGKASENNEMQNDSTIVIKFEKDSSSALVKAKMKGINFPITVYIPIKAGKELTAKITPEDSVANIRFNQIFMPNGKADGPFGRDLKYAIDQQGTYKLIIKENLMQGDEWKGNFKLTVTVK